MQTTCKFCGASVDTAMKICPGCGKILPTYRKAAAKKEQQFSKESETEGLAPGTSGNVRTTYAATRSARQMKGAEEDYGTAKTPAPQDYDPVAKAKQQHVPFQGRGNSGKREHASRIVPLVSTLVKIILVLAILLAAYCFVRVMMVRQSSYDFKLDSDIKLESSTYGEAFGTFFDKGRWWFELRTNDVTYKGTDADGNEWDMKFKKENGQTTVYSLYINGERISDEGKNIMKNYILGTFMATKENRGGPLWGGYVEIK